MKLEETVHEFKCDFSSWENRLLEHRKSLENSEGIMLGCLEDEWQQINWDDKPDKRKDVNRVSDNPLSILEYYLEMCTYPPPELLLVIVDMFKTYKLSAGSRSLEDVFFGPTKKGVGNYAARKSRDRSMIYRMFLLVRSNEKYKRFSDIHLVEHLKTLGVELEELQKQHILNMKTATKNERKQLSNQYFKDLNKFPLGASYFTTIKDEESFLRQFRRWKSKK